VKPFRIGTGRLGIALLVFLVVLNQLQVGISLRLSFFNRDFYNAIQEKDANGFWYQLIYVFSVWAAIAVISNLIEIVANYTLLIRWRRWMAEKFSGAWLNNANHYRISLAGTADNPDQRIAEDTRAFVNQTYNFALPLLTQVSTLVSFSIILWSIPVASVVPGTEISIPGFIFWMALIYSVAATWIAHLIGRPMIGLEFEQEKREANFRYSLARLREYSEQIALMRGEGSEQRHLSERFGDIVTNFYRLVWARVRLTTFTLSFAQANVVVPYILLAPHYFSGKITLGIMTQVASASTGCRRRCRSSSTATSRSPPMSPRSTVSPPSRLRSPRHRRREPAARTPRSTSRRSPARTRRSRRLRSRCQTASQS
jgi:putative ATP-binding cassette transporter